MTEPNSAPVYCSMRSVVESSVTPLARLSEDLQLPLELSSTILKDKTINSIHVRFVLRGKMEKSGMRAACASSTLADTPSTRAEAVSSKH